MADRHSRTRTKSSTLYWRRDNTNEDAKQPDKPPHETKVRATTAARPQRITLRQLCSKDKHRVRQLIQELASSGVEREKLEERLGEERGRFRELLASAAQQCRELTWERNQLEIELADSQLQLQTHAHPHPPSHPHPHTQSHPHMQTTYRPSLSVASSPQHPLSSAARTLLAPESLMSSTVAHPLAQTDIQPSLPNYKAVNVESVLNFPVQNPQPRLHSNPAQQANYRVQNPQPRLHSNPAQHANPLVRNPHPRLHSNPAQQANSSTLHIPSARYEEQCLPRYEQHEPNIPASCTWEATARSSIPYHAEGSEPGPGGIQPALVRQTPEPSVAVSHAPIHSSSDNSGGPLGTSYPRFTTAHPVPSRDPLPSSQHPNSHQRPHQSIPTPGECVVTLAEPANRETSVRRQPRECDPQSPSSPLGARAFAERYRPESSTPPVEDWSSLPPATPLQPQDGGDSPCTTWDGVSQRDEPASESRCGTPSQPVPHRDAGTQTASTEFEPSILPLKQSPATLSTSRLPNTRSTNADSNDNDSKETKDTAVQTAATDRCQPVAYAGDNSFVSHKQTAVRTEESESLPRGVRRRQEVTSVNSRIPGAGHQEVTSVNSRICGAGQQEVTSVKPLGHSRIPGAGLLSPILPSKLAPTPSLSWGEQAESTTANQAHLDAMMATALLNAQDTVNSIRSLARLNRSLVSGRASSTALASPGPEGEGHSLTGGNFPAPSASRRESPERSLSPSELLFPRKKNLVSEPLDPRGAPGLHSDPRGAPGLHSDPRGAPGLRGEAAARQSSLLSSWTARSSSGCSCGMAQGRVRRRPLETGTEWDSDVYDDDRDIIEELFFIT